MRALLVVLALVVAARLAGLFTVGFVATGSMEPELPAGSVFLAWRQSPEIGDVVVYRGPGGAVVVHRVVASGPDGLVTKGDANERTDQELGVPPVDPRGVAVLPEVRGAPLALRSEWLRPAAVIALQTALVAAGLHGAVVAARRAPRRGALARMRPHHLVAAAAVVFVVAAPAFSDTVQARGEVEVRGGILPTHVRVESDEGVARADVAPFASATLPAAGAVEVVRAPAFPGARAFAEHGAVAAALPAAAAFLAVAAVLRWRGW